MANQNQSPASQASVTLSGITFPLTLAGTPTLQVLPPLELIVVGGSLSLAPAITVLARALGRATAVSSSTASGLFTPNEQSAAKRLGAWPTPPA